MITPSFALTATERVLPRMALDFTTATLDVRVTFTRALATATRTNASGYIEGVVANTPRFDYDPVTLACKGLLIEESRANVLLNSLIDGTILETQIVATTAVAYTLSFYGTGNIVLSGASIATVTGTGAYPSRKTFTFTPTVGALTLTISGTVQYAQLEVGAFPTSYIPTTTTALTRNADVAVMTGTNFSNWYNASEGTFVTSGTVLNNAAPFQADDGTTDNRIYCTIRPSGGSGGPGNVIVGGVIQTSSFGNFNNVTTNTAAISYKLNNFMATLNGATVTTDASGTVPTVNTLRFMNNTSSTNTGWVRKLMYFPQVLTSAELSAFTK